MTDDDKNDLWCVALLFIGLVLLGVYGAWWLNHINAVATGEIICH